MTQEPWWAVLSRAQLRVALRGARAANGLCLVRDGALVRRWLGSGRQLPQIPLVRFLEDDFVLIAQYGPYAISVRITSANLPVVASVSPSNRATEVPLNAKLGAVFNHSMDRASTATAFSLVRTSDRRAVAGRVVFFGDQVPLFLPSKPLAPGTRYTATISTTATDRVGNHLRTAEKWTFTTRRG